MNGYRVSLCLLLAIYTITAMNWSLQPKEPMPHLIPSQYMFPPISTHLVTFNQEEKFEKGDPFETEEGPWIDLIPLGKGHIAIEDPKKWRLSGGYPASTESSAGAEVYTISVFHQLHCLASLKSEFERLKVIEEGGEPSPSPHKDRLFHGHLNHCFDYLRQAIMCSGDTTLEKSMTVEGKIVRGVDGWGVTHECRDYDAIFTFATKHRSRDQRGIA